jgi:DNA-directed RNA polymerase II subunit RPB1
MEWKQLEDDRRVLRTCFKRPDASIYLPCNLRRLIWNAQKIFNVDTNRPSSLSPLRVIDGVHELSQRLIVVSGDDPMSKEAQVWIKESGEID